MAVDDEETEITTVPSLTGSSSFPHPLPPGPSSSAAVPGGATVAGGRFKGVVLQQNGNWGAQIYANQQRIWLGTFKSESSAAVAYDRAATKLRSGDPHRNFPFSLSPLEPTFQDLHSTEALLAMIRDGSYEPKFAQFLRSTGGAAAAPAVHGGGGLAFQELFRKELTPSDVGKLNRLVIPKKHAVKFFPGLQTSAAGDGGAAAEGLMVAFRDLQERRWEFRYCYWRSSQSFVFTKGWNRFVKTKGLRPKDVVIFYRGEDMGGRREPFLLIDVARPHDGAAEEPPETPAARGGERGEALLRGGSGEDGWGRRGGEAEEGEAAAALETKKAFRLFGVQIRET